MLFGLLVSVSARVCVCVRARACIYGGLQLPYRFPGTDCSPVKFLRSGINNQENVKRVEIIFPQKKEAVFVDETSPRMPHVHRPVLFDTTHFLVKGPFYSPFEIVGSIYIFRFSL